MPPEVSLREKLLVLLPTVALSAGTYLYLNRYPIVEPQQLPLLWIDRQTPFLTWTIWPYVLMIVFYVSLPLLVTDRKIFRQTVAAYFIAIAINTTVWTLFPTTYPRPAPPTEPGLSTELYLAMMTLDSPLNCLPSGHITVPTVLVWALAQQWKRYAVVVWSLLFVLAPSILTTKQHYFWDLVAGGSSAAFGIAVVIYVERRRAARA